jgi:TetR/AcrR family transcriptional regulator, transcriptional repressor of bet genes
MEPVDHNERRQKIAQITFELIAREGVEAATIRRIAAEVGYSTTAITHYFAEKRDLLTCAYRYLVDQSNGRFNAVIARDPGDLVGSLLSSTATDETSIRFWRVYIAFWERAARDITVREQQRHDMDNTLKEIGRIIKLRYPDCRDVERISRMLSATVQGISIQVLVNRESWPPAKIREALEHEVCALLGDVSTAARATHIV